MDEQIPFSQAAYPSDNWDSQFASEMQKATEVLLDDKFVEDKMGHFPIWSMATKSSKLTFLKNWEVPIFESHLEDMIINEIMDRPPCTIDDDTIQFLNQVRAISWFNIRRSAGSETNVLNERTALVTQISQSIGGAAAAPRAAKKGFFQKLFGMG